MIVLTNLHEYFLDVGGIERTGFHERCSNLLCIHGAPLVGDLREGAGEVAESQSIYSPILRPLSPSLLSSHAYMAQHEQSHIQYTIEDTRKKSR